MWLHGGLAADAPSVAQDSNSIILAVIGLLTAVLVAVATGVFSLLSAKQSRASQTSPAPTVDHVLFERVAVLERRADDNDERDDIQDRRLDHIERAKDHDHPGWRTL